MIPKMDLPAKHKFVQLSKIDPEAFRGLEDTLQVGILMGFSLSGRKSVENK